MNMSTNPSGSKSKVFLREADYATAASSIKELMSLSGIEFRGKKVLVKPNILLGATPEKAVTTHPSIVSSTVDFLLKAGADVTVGDNPGLSGYGAATAAAIRSGIADASQGHFLNISSDCRRVPVKSRFLESTIISGAVADADIIINIPKLKTHIFTLYTGAIKNMFGMLVGAEKAGIHSKASTPENFSEALVDVFSLRPPDLTIMDAIVCMEGNGPNVGSPRTLGLIGMSVDSVAIDATFCRLIGFDPLKVHHIRMAASRNLGRIRREEIEIDGPFPKIKRFSIPIPRRFDMLGNAGGFIFNRVLLSGLTGYARLKLRKKACTKCGICVEHCPASAMKTDASGFPFIEKEKCIACYCCNELCPKTAWSPSGVMSFMRLWKG